MKRVLRIETPDGGGIYRGNFSGGAWYDGDYSNPAHPLPYEDAALSEGGYRTFREKWGPSIMFGFTSWEQLRQWVYKQDWRDALHGLGCRVVEFEVANDKAILGDTQAVFIRAHARKVATFTIAGEAVPNT